MSRRYQVIGGSGVAFSSGGTTVNVIPKADGTGGLKDSALTDNATNVISTEAFLAPAGTSALPPYSFSAGTANGMFMSSNTIGLIASNGAQGWIQVTPNSGGVSIQPAAPLGWSSSATIFNSTTPDAAFRRRTTANIQLGIAADVNGTPVAQTLSVQNAITGSNLPAANTTVDLGLGTGTGLTGTFVVRGGDSSVASGTTAQTNIIRVVLNATKALTSGAATTLVSIPLASLQMTGGYISVYMEATDGTNQATRCEEVYYSGVNSAGVFVVSTGVVGTGVTACTATKTLTATYALTSANPALLQVTPTLTGITATRFTCVYQVNHGGNTQPTI